jgi:class 3 adenylate cyclase
LDRTVAVFGAPVALAQPAESALRAAFALRDAWKRHNTEWVDRLGVPLEASFALHAGILTVGPVGGEQHREYAVFGAEAEAGYALLDRAAPDQVLASERLQSQVTASADSAVVDQSEDGRNLFELSPSP